MNLVDLVTVAADMFLLLCRLSHFVGKGILGRHDFGCFLGYKLIGRGHEFRTCRIHDRFVKNPIDFNHGGRVDIPTGQARDLEGLRLTAKELD